MHYSNKVKGVYQVARAPETLQEHVSSKQLYRRMCRLISTLVGGVQILAVVIQNLLIVNVAVEKNRENKSLQPLPGPYLIMCCWIIIRIIILREVPRYP